MHRGHKSGNEGVLCERGNRKRSVGKKEREGERERAVSFFVYAAVVLPVVDPVPDVSGRSFGRFFSRPFYLSRYYYSHPAPRRLRIPRSPRFRRCGRRAGNRPALRPKENISLPPELSIHGRFLWDCKNWQGVNPIHHLLQFQETVELSRKILRRIFSFVIISFPSSNYD